MDRMHATAAAFGGREEKVVCWVMRLGCGLLLLLPWLRVVPYTFMLGSFFFLLKCFGSCTVKGYVFAVIFFFTAV